MPEDTGADRGWVAGGLVSTADSWDAGQRSAAVQADRARDVLNQLARSLLDVGVLVKTAADLPGDAARLQTIEALSGLDDAVQAARAHVSAEHGPGANSSLAGSPLRVPGRLRWSAGRAALLRERLVQTMCALQRSAAETVRLLEQRADLVQEPGGIDYRTKIKRWRAFADQAEQMAKRLEQER